VTNSSKIQSFFKIATQLKFSELFNMAIYRLGLRSGYYKFVTHSFTQNNENLELNPKWTKKILAASNQVKDASIFPPTLEADEICAGRYRLFGGEPVALRLNPGGNLSHWTQYERGKAKPEVEDIKFIWEPARFGWAIILARAYALTEKPIYAQKFWQLVEEFLNANPAYNGPNWTSAQEAAIRIISLSFALPIFWSSSESSPDRKNRIMNSLIAHAERILPTLSYARAQNNNHLLLEGVGFFTAGIILDGHSRSKRWKKKGWKQINWCFQHQIDSDGEYCQHSMNYHRLMLQAALWTNSLCQLSEIQYPVKTLQRLTAATNWLIAYVDQQTGLSPNLGHNDGALILPFSKNPYSDYRPTVQAAAVAFLNSGVYESGPQDEMRLWLNLDNPKAPKQNLNIGSPAVHVLENGEAKGFIRSIHYKDRPAHADQLHVDLWWQGQNITLDPGTYQYNSASPWDNGLAKSIVHNTVTIDGLDQMTRHSRFLWLDWAQSKIIEKSNHSIIAEHGGYKKLGLIHRRTLTTNSPQQWEVIDQIIKDKENLATHQVILNWSFPDGEWSLDAPHYSLSLPDLKCKVTIEVLNGTSNNNPSMQMIRAGKLIYGNGESNPLLGWYSPTYGEKKPALSFRVIFSDSDSLRFRTIFQLGKS
jgi:hypothetical protein